MEDKEIKPSKKQSKPPADKQVKSQEETKKEKKEDDHIEDIKLNRTYEVGQWGSYKQYKCRLCPFDTLHEDKIISHVWSVHGPRFERSTILGEDGLPLIKEV